jgi:hypothetical protein
LRTRYGAIDKRVVNTFREATEDLPQHIDHSRRLDEQTLELRQKGTVRVRLKIDPVTILASVEDTGVNERGELPLETGRANAEMLGEIAEIPPPLGMKQGRSQEGLPDSRKEGIEGSCLTHIT